MCTLQPDSLCTLHMYPHSLGSCLGCVCVCVGGMVAAQCPVMDEGGGGDFPRGRLAPGSYDLSHALLSFCWAPLQSHSLQRLLSQGWGQGLSNVCMLGVLDPSPREPLMPETRALSVAMKQPSRIVKKRNKLQFSFSDLSLHPEATLYDRMGRGAHSFIHSFTWQRFY